MPTPVPTVKPTVAPTPVPTPIPTPTPVGTTGFWSNGHQIPASFVTSIFGDSGPFYQQLPSTPRLASYSSSAISYYYSGNPDFEFAFVDANSGQAQYDYSFPIYVATSSDPLVTINCNHLAVADCVDGGVQIRLPSQAKQAGGGDHHLGVLEPNGIEYDFWLVTSNPPYSNGSQISAAGEAHFALNGSNFGSAFVAPGFDVGAATAGGIALSIGQVYVSELATGTINHAISLLYPCGTSNWVYPASQTTGICANGQGMPLGSRLWWAPSDSQTQGMSIPRDLKTILIAMHHYGAFFTDNGGGSTNINGQGVGSGGHLENQEPYWIYGNGNDPVLNYASSAGWNHISTSSGVNRYLLAGAGGTVNFLGNLKVLDPCVTQKTC